MIRFRNLPLALAALVAALAHGTASHAQNTPAQATRAGSAAACPSTDFNRFANAFADSEAVQRAFTAYPLKMKRLDPAALPEPKVQAISLNRGQVPFPLVPQGKGRRAAGISVELEAVSPRHARATIHSDDNRFVSTFRFTRNGCWMLTSVEDRTFVSGEAVARDWLERTMYMKEGCTPMGFYFDKETGRTNSGLLEKLGYRPYKVDEYEAYYRVRETFYGLPVTGIVIPSSTVSVHTVVVAANAKTLAGAIEKKTGKKPPIAGKNFKAKSGVGFIQAKGSDQSTLTCFSYEE